MLIVQKFGGTSVGSAERMAECAKIVQQSLNEGHQVIVVVSAMAGHTNNIVALCDAVDFLGAHSNVHEDLSTELTHKLPSVVEFPKKSNYSLNATKHRDVALSSAEILSAGLMCLSLEKREVKSIAVQGWQVPIYTNEAFGNAEVLSLDTTYLVQLLKRGITPVVCGFQGITKEGDISTLGRGGSDITAAAISAAIGADRCDIYTDVDGVYSCDPKKVDAIKMPVVNYELMVEMGLNGAKVMHHRASEIAQKHSLNLWIKSSFGHSDGGTMLACDGGKDAISISVWSNVSLISVAHDVFEWNKQFFSQINHIVERECNNTLDIALSEDNCKIFSNFAKIIDIKSNLSKISVVKYNIDSCYKEYVAKINILAQNLAIDIKWVNLRPHSIGIFIAAGDEVIIEHIHNCIIKGETI